MSQNIKLVALDIDGTLLAPGVPYDAVPDDSVVEAVAALKASGIVVMLATGRMYPGTAPIANHLGIEEPIICQQGASIHHPNGELRHAYSIDQDIALELYEFAVKHGYSLAQMSLAFVCQQPFVTSCLIGATTMEQLKENIDAAELTLSDEVMSEITAIHNQYPDPAP